MMDLKFSAQYEPLRETEEYVEFDVLALSTAPIERYFGTLQFPAEILSESAPSLVGKPLLLDHSYSVEDIVGIVTNAEFAEEKNGIVATARIPKSGNEKLVALLKMNPSPIQSVSVGVVVDAENVNNFYTAKSCEFKELSIVLEGADKNAKRFSAKDYEHWWDDADLRSQAPVDYFLDPASRKYPYKTWDGQISCERLLAAMQLSSLHGHRQIYERAKALYKRHCNKEE
jgi:hypothetical protein